MNINYGIKNLLKLISLLQDNSLNISDSSKAYTNSSLGPIIECAPYNTRVINIFNKNGDKLTAYLANDNPSTYFRIQHVNDDNCLLLILYKIGGNYFSSCETIAVNLNCICAIKCLDDVFINNINV